MSIFVPRPTIARVVVMLGATASCGSPGGSSFAGGSDAGYGGATGAGNPVGTLGVGDGAASSGTSSAGEACTTLGAEQSCCGMGTQTCLPSGEFSVWGPCVSQAGTTLTCPGVSSGCSASEAKTGCSGDGGGGGNGGGGGPPDGGGVPSLCTDPSINTEPGILVAYAPSLGQSVGSQGQIKVWVNDEGAPFISSGEQVDPTTGAVTTPGARSATAPDGLLWEPAIYLAPQTPLNGGVPYFPDWIKGTYNNAPPTAGRGITGAAIDPLPSGTVLHDKYTAEYVWDVSAMGLTPGRYTAVFVVHDGDRDRGIGCVTMSVTP